MSIPGSSEPVVIVSNDTHVGPRLIEEQWFEAAQEGNYVLWSIASQHRPDLVEGMERLRHIRRYGPSDFAFDFDYGRGRDFAEERISARPDSSHSEATRSR